jgi:hypothetical protein
VELCRFRRVYQVSLDELGLVLPPALGAGDELAVVDRVFEQAGNEVVLERLLDTHELAPGK